MKYSIGILLAASVSISLSSIPSVADQCAGDDKFPWLNPCIEPADRYMAKTKPDEYAWQLFAALNWPANAATKSADASKKFGDDGTVVWETWRLGYKEVYHQDGRDPGPWLGGAGPVARRAIELAEIPLQLSIARDDDGNDDIQLQVDENNLGGNETRLNEPTYWFIRKHELYNIDGQEKLFTSGVTQIDFPQGAKEIKAQWRRLDHPDCPLDATKYHTATVDNNGSQEVWGLTSLHITTKDLPDWFWATFEHVDNPKLCGVLSPPGIPNLDWQTKSADSYSCPSNELDCNKAPDAAWIKGTKWEHYRLRGTQIDFVDANGEPTILANSQPEAPFQETSSCITCHARATIGQKLNLPLDRANRLSVFRPNGEGHVGAADPAWFQNADGSLRYTKLDFVWSFFRACRVGGGGCRHPCAINPSICQ